MILQLLALDFLLALSLPAPSHPLKGDYDSDNDSSEISSTLSSAKGSTHHNQRLQLWLHGNADSKPHCYFSGASTLSEALKILRNPDKEKEMKQQLKMEKNE